VKNARNQQLSPSDVRRYLGGLANKLLDNSPLRDDERIFLANCLGCISGGDSADEVFGIRNGQGRSTLNESQRLKLSLVTHWVANAICTVSEGGLGLSFEQAFREAEKQFSPSNPTATYANIKNAWYKEKYEHMKSPVRRADDPDFPY